MTSGTLIAPFPYFGGKSRIAGEVWRRLGTDVRNYIEPFCGSAAMLLARPQPFDGVETINDADGMVANFWRALQHDPEQVAHWADWIVSENDMTARHIWLVNRKESLQTRLEGDPDFYDAKIAGWWCWGLCCWIGRGWCSGKGAWQSVDGKLVRRRDLERDAQRQSTHPSNAGVGISRGIVYLRRTGMGIHCRRVLLDGLDTSVNRKSGIETCAERTSYLINYMQRLADRLRLVRVCCGDWRRVCDSAATLKPFTPTAVFLDPPYSHAERAAALYATEMAAANDVRDWAIEHGDDPEIRIALCGYDGEHDMPDTWSVLSWQAGGGYSNTGNTERGKANRRRERVWFSPHCLPEERTTRERLF